MSLNIGFILERQEAEDDYFKILGCTPTSSDEQIIAEYKIRALKCHPDKNPGSESALQEFQKLQEARDILTDPELRRTYDKWKSSEICIPFKKWLSMNNRCATTMHWAKPKDQTMLECSSSQKRPSDEELLTAVNSQGSTSTDIKLSSRKEWKSDTTSGVYKEFRNYKI